MRTGFGEQDDSLFLEEQKILVSTSMATLGVFASEAMETAGKYAIGNGRKKVSGDDMQRALKYECRTFFAKTNDDDLSRRVKDIREKMQDSGDDEDDEEDEEDEDDEDEDDDEDDDDDKDDDEDDDEDDEQVDEAEKAKFANLVANVNAVASHWDSYCPSDPVQQLIKRAIDKAASEGEK